VELVREVLDKQVLNRDGVKIGKVDGIVVELIPRQAPRVAYIEMGGVTLVRRLGSLPGTIAAALAGAFGEKHNTPYRLPWNRVRRIGLDIELDVAGELSAWQRWLRDNIIRRIPGA
jgi:sporulation protein YlmC with PRC-barrel domain